MTCSITVRLVQVQQTRRLTTSLVAKDHGDGLNNVLMLAFRSFARFNGRLK